MGSDLRRRRPLAHTSLEPTRAQTSASGSSERSTSCTAGKARRSSTSAVAPGGISNGRRRWAPPRWSASTPRPRCCVWPTLAYGSPPRLTSNSTAGASRTSTSMTTSMWSSSTTCPDYVTEPEALIQAVARCDGRLIRRSRHDLHRGSSHVPATGACEAWRRRTSRVARCPHSSVDRACRDLTIERIGPILFATATGPTSMLR